MLLAFTHQLQIQAPRPGTLTLTVDTQIRRLRALALAFTACARARPRKLVPRGGGVADIFLVLGLNLIGFASPDERTIPLFLSRAAGTATLFQHRVP